MKRLYLDHAASAPVLPSARREYLRGLDIIGNPSSAHSFGREARAELERCTERIAELIDCDPEEIVYTSGATEGNAMVLNRKAYNFTSPLEHPSVAKWNEILLPNPPPLWKSRDLFFCDPYGNITVNKLGDPPYINVDFMGKLASVMLASNEIGTVQDIKKINKKLYNYGLFVHTDATAAVGHIPVSFRDLGVDFLTCSAHKFGGVRGTGLLIARRNAPPAYLMRGGAQQRGRRPGTENLAGIMAMTAALEERTANMDVTKPKLTAMRDRIIYNLLAIDGAFLNGGDAHRLPNHISIGFRGVSGDALAALLDEQGICVSTGSACHTGEQSPSKALLAIGRTPEEALSTIRITFGEDLTEEDAGRVVTTITKAVDILRRNGMQRKE